MEKKKKYQPEVKEGQTVWILPRLEAGIFDPKKVCRVIRCPNETLIKVSFMPDQRDPPIPIHNIIDSERAARRISRTARNKRKRETKDHYRWLASLQKTVTT